MSHFFKGILKYFTEQASDVNQFTQGLATYFRVGEDQIFLFGSGRMGLYLFLKSVGFKEGDELLLPGYTCVAVPNVPKYLGINIRYVDISKSTLNIDTTLLLDSINENTRAIVIPHNFGIVDEDMDVIRRLHPDILMIEDAAHTFGSVDQRGAKAGLLGDASFFSFEYSKPITTGMGGLLIVNNLTLVPRVQREYDKIMSYPLAYITQMMVSLAAHLLTSLPHFVFLKGVLLRMLRKANLVYETRGAEIMGEMPKHYPARLADCLACIGSMELRDIEHTNGIKKEIAAGYHNAFAGIPSISDFYRSDRIYVRYPLLISDEVSIGTIGRIRERVAREVGLILGEWFNDVVHPKGSFRYMYTEGECKVGENVANRIINLPVNIHSPILKEELFQIRQILLDELGKV